MLGINKTKYSWNWAVYGKHPVARDYFMLGADTPIFKAFSSWVENGYKHSDLQTGNTICSFRFWAKGHEKETLICGVVRDSSDSLGRPYPLLIIGMGRIKGLKRNWERVLPICDPIWYHIERLCTKNYADITYMEHALRDITLPKCDWKALEARTQMPEKEEQAKVSLTQEWGGLDQEKEAFISLNSAPQEDQMEKAGRLHHMLKSFSKELPNAVFLGGIPEKSCMAVFMRPLQTNDFFKLWSFC